MSTSRPMCHSSRRRSRRGFIGRHLTFVPLCRGSIWALDELQVAVTKEQVQAAPNIEQHGMRSSPKPTSPLSTITTSSTTRHLTPRAVVGLLDARSGIGQKALGGVATGCWRQAAGWVADSRLAGRRRREGRCPWRVLDGEGLFAMFSRPSRSAFTPEDDLRETAEDHHHRAETECQEDRLVASGVDHAAEHLWANYPRHDPGTDRVENCGDAQRPRLQWEYLRDREIGRRWRLAEAKKKTTQQHAVNVVASRGGGL